MTKPTLLADYKAPTHQIDEINLNFDLSLDATVVTFSLNVRCVAEEGTPLVLQGEGVSLVSVSVDGKESQDYTVDDYALTLPNLPRQCELTIITKIEPVYNTRLEGLYYSNGLLCTQCEAEGFRRITYFLDRPDVLARYTVRLVGDKTLFPTLLSNGNLIDSGDLPDGKHFAVWQDPFKKPCYLFAIVAGRLAFLEDTFVTQSGKQVKLFIYSEERYLGRLAFAMEALKKAMLWDEIQYGREYDLDRFSLVAISDFNMGAMENKGLNVFNVKFLVSDPKITTDDEYEAILSVVAHEYFHNWSGNRVTCRDWFQLSLKEGLTVFREQHFMEEMSKTTVNRLEQVKVLRSSQFTEDQSPLAHPVRPQSYIKIDNFYTATVYEKGAEIVRMIRAWLGDVDFRKGMDNYFAKYDGQAVTLEDFLQALGEVNMQDLSIFLRWYETVGTPVMRTEGQYNEQTHEYTLQLNTKPALPIPVRMALIGEKSGQLLLGPETICLLEGQATRVFKVPEKPVPSLLRGFSAPVILQGFSDESWWYLAHHDDDLFNRSEGLRYIFLSHFKRLLARYPQAGSHQVAATLVQLWQDILHDFSMDPAWVAHVLQMPSLHELAVDASSPLIVEAICGAELTISQGLALSCFEDWCWRYDALTNQTPGERALKNVCLDYFTRADAEVGAQRAWMQFNQADTMTECLGALRALSHVDHARWYEALASFEAKWSHEPLVMLKWFTIQATSRIPSVWGAINVLTEHPAFSWQNPNVVRALVGAFAERNFAGFHQISGEGYRLVGEAVMRLDDLNPHSATKIVQAFRHWRDHTLERKSLMKAVLTEIYNKPSLSSELGEVIERLLANS